MVKKQMTNDNINNMHGTKIPIADLQILTGDNRELLAQLPAESVQCCVTSPPYWGLRDYEHVSQIGAEPTPEQYVLNLVEVFREVRRVLRKDGTLWLNVGDEKYVPVPNFL
jgi:DNA modification methylase